MDIGTELQQMRERRDISLYELSERTKIALPLLRAIEANDFESIPGGVFTRGYLRAFAREVGLDPEAIVGRYAAEYAPPPAVVAEDQEAIEVDPIHIHTADLEDFARQEQRGHWMSTAAVVMVAVLGYFMLARATPGPPADAPQSVASAGAETQLIGTSGVVDLTPPAALVPVARADALHVEIEPAGPCWVGATVDGKPAVQRLMNAGERESMDGAEEVVLRVGDAAVCGFSINGSRGRANGTAGQPVTLRITKQNFREFMAS